MKPTKWSANDTIKKEYDKIFDYYEKTIRDSLGIHPSYLGRKKENSSKSQAIAMAEYMKKGVTNMFEWKEDNSMKSRNMISYHCRIGRITMSAYRTAGKIWLLGLYFEKYGFENHEEAKTWCEQTALAKAKELISELTAFVEEVEK